MKKLGKAKAIIEHKEKSEFTRINKLLSENGFCSRREGDKLIEQGRVTINGVKAQQGDKVSAKDTVKVDNKVITLKNKFVYIAFNKPVGITCTTDPKDKDNIVDYINYPVGIFPMVA